MMVTDVKQSNSFELGIHANHFTEHLYDIIG